MVAGALTLSLVLLAGPADGAGDVSAAVEAATPIVRSEETETAPPATVPPADTFNEFLPEDRGLGECISALPKPGCGSEARGGWRQGLILLAILLGLAFIVWRVVRSARRTGPQGPTAASEGDPPSPTVVP